LSYVTPQSFTVNQAIATPIAPTVTGSVSTWSVNPPLPQGLTFSTADGSISGTPAALSPRANYTVTASNSGGQSTSVIAIAVVDPKPVISYPAATVALATGLPVTLLVPRQTASGGEPDGMPVSWTISPALPAGLTLSSTDGSITGSPTADFAATTYTVTATSSGGATTTPLILSSQPGVLLDLGHSAPVSVLRFDGSRLFSMDVSGHWVLWNYATGAKVASGDTACTQYTSVGPTCASPYSGDMQNQVVAIQTLTGFEIRAAADGHLLSNINSNPGGTITTATAAAWWKLATDGGYVVVGNFAGGLQVWSAAGVSLLSMKGPDYTPNAVFAAPGELRAGRVYGTQAWVEKTTVSTGVTYQLANINGTFKIWFQDGNRFLTAAGNTLLTYSAAGAPLDTTAVSSVSTIDGLAAAGDWFVNDHKLYKVGASSAPAATFNDSTANPGFFAFTPAATALYFPVPASASVAFINLSGATPVRTDAPLPTNAGLFAAASTTQWVAGNSYGVLFDGASTVAAPRYLGYGAALSIAGSSNRFAIATASGRVLHYDAATSTLEGTLPLFTRKLRLSADGAVMAVLGDLDDFGAQPDTTSRIYSLPGEGVVNTIPLQSGGFVLRDLSLSGSGTVLGQLLFQNNQTTAVTIPVTGGPAVLSTTVPCAEIVLSPDGSHVACPAVLGEPDGLHLSSQNATQLFNNGVLVSGLSGLGLAWLDNDSLLVGDHVAADVMSENPAGGSLYSPSGSLLGKTNLAPRPAIHRAEPVTSKSIYAPEYNTIVNVNSGETLWTSGVPSDGVGAVAGSNVIFASGHQVLALSH